MYYPKQNYSKSTRRVVKTSTTDSGVYKNTNIDRNIEIPLLRSAIFLFLNVVDIKPLQYGVINCISIVWC